MKTGPAMIISSIILSIAIILSAYKISSKIYPPSGVPSNLSVTNYDGDKNLNNVSDSKEFITLFEATSYLGVDDQTLNELINSGKLDGTFTSYKRPGGIQYIFSKAKLSEWMKKAIENGKELR